MEKQRNNGIVHYLNSLTKDTLALEEFLPNEESMTDELSQLNKETQAKNYVEIVYDTLATPHFNKKTRQNVMFAIKLYSKLSQSTRENVNTILTDEKLLKQFADDTRLSIPIDLFRQRIEAFLKKGASLTQKNNGTVSE